ncbi:MAG: helix-turn-helix domain-containing protein [Bdellovibrionales bacterium]|nr:helix-turn-helix domain-containing protein [Bdellovibrionales bacterium]
MKKTGQLLRESREKQNLTISEVSLATKINPRVLQAMENGELEKLPALSFLRGFIRTYATHLKMDGDELLSKFNEEQNLEETSSEEPLVEKEKLSPTWYQKVPLMGQSSIASKSLAAMGILILIGLIVGIKGLVKKYENESLVVQAPEDLVSLKHEKEKSSELEEKEQFKSQKQEGTQPSNSELARSDVNHVMPPPSTEKPSEVLPSSGLSEEKVKLNSKPTDTKAIEEDKKEAAENKRDIVKPVSEDQPKEDAGTILKDIPQEVILEALDKVEISFRIDGGSLKKIVLQPEQIHTIKAAQSIAIDLVDGGAVNVIHNGVDKGVPGDLGKPKKVKYP